MNSTTISKEKLLELKDLAKKIDNLDIQITCFGNDDILNLQHRKLTEQITKIIKTL